MATNYMKPKWKSMTVNPQHTMLWKLFNYLEKHHKIMAKYLYYKICWGKEKYAI